MNILHVKLFIAEPEYYQAKGNDKSDGIAKQGDGNGDKFFKTAFGVPVYTFHEQEIPEML
jgi:hypothetical protein